MTEERDGVKDVQAGGDIEYVVLQIEKMKKRKVNKKERQIDKQTDCKRETERELDKQTDKIRESEIEMDQQTDRQAYRQIDIT